MSETVQRNIRVGPEQWERIEIAAMGSNLTANQLVIELALEALDRREWPRTEYEIRLLHSSMFTAQAVARHMNAAGRGDEVEQNRRSISAVVPDSPDDRPDPRLDARPIAAMSRVFPVADNIAPLPRDRWLARPRWFRPVTRCCPLRCSLTTRPPHPAKTGT